MKADLIVESNQIFDSVSDTPFSGFVAIQGNRILAVSKDLWEKEQYLGENTKVLSYGDNLVMPGFFDAHVHLILGGMFRTFVDLGPGMSEEECAEICWEYAKNHPIEGWLIGFNWYQFRWHRKVLPTKKSLDKYFPDTPVMLLNSEAHNAWVNSKALELCHITRDTPDPYGGHIEKDEFGEPTGFLNESAMSLATPIAFHFTEAQERAFVTNFQQSCLSLGITSVIDVKPYFGVDLGDMDSLMAMEQDGALQMRVHCAPDLFSDLDVVADNAKKYHTEKIRANFVKQFIDGVIPTHTALMLEDYTDAPGNHGFPICDLDRLKEAIAQAHKRDLSVKIHAIGDGGIRYVLDCYEDALKRFGPSKSRHAIEHLELVDPADYPRFGQLGVIPSVQPEHIGLNPRWDEEPYNIALGYERATHVFSLQTLLESAGVLALGTDCPVVDSNPFLGLHRGMTRLHDDLLPEGGWNPPEKLTLAQLLKHYTYGSAYSASREGDLGTLEPGKLADLVVVDRNLFAIPPEEIRTATVTTTIMDGKVVYEAT